jgi:hypothetical protein
MPGKLTTLTAAALLALCACACATPSPVGREDAGPGDAKRRTHPRVVCENEADTGSNITNRVCRPIDDLEWERQVTRNRLLWPENHKPKPGEKN